MSVISSLEDEPFAHRSEDKLRRPKINVRLHRRLTVLIAPELRFCRSEDKLLTLENQYFAALKKNFRRPKAHFRRFEENFCRPEDVRSPPKINFSSPEVEYFIRKRAKMVEISPQSQTSRQGRDDCPRRTSPPHVGSVFTHHKWSCCRCSELWPSRTRNLSFRARRLYKIAMAASFWAGAGAEMAGRNLWTSRST